VVLALEQELVMEEALVQGLEMVAEMLQEVLLKVI